MLCVSRLQAAALYRQHGILLRDVDGLAREAQRPGPGGQAGDGAAIDECQERAAAGRADSASELLRRDRRRAVAATTKQLWEPGQSCQGQRGKEA